jgi:hypothetical protein
LIPFNLNKNTNGTIEQRQTTFVRFKTSEGQEYKIRFQNKMEFLIEPGIFKGVFFDPKHPLLKHYRDDFLKIYISSKFDKASKLVKELKDLIGQEYNGWREFNQYFNTQYDIEKLIKEGFGLLYDGPSVLGFKVSHTLNQYSVTHNFKKYRSHRKPNMRALVLGENVIVAEEFKFEKFRP